MLDDVIKLWDGREVSAIDVYRDVFRLGEGFIQKKDEPAGEYKANAIGYWKNNNSSHGHYRILFEDTFEETLKELQDADFSIVNGISYFGRKNVQAHASKMFAMIFDLDGVTDKTLNNFLHGAFAADAYPIPNYIILSGHGVHLYYIFEDPVPLFPNIKLQLKELKYAMTDRIWNGYTSTLKTKQKQGINQGFRVIGGKTKEGATEERVRAFKINSIPFSLKSFARYVPEAMQVDESKLFRESRMTLEKAKKAYPEWYEKVVVKGDRTPDRWKIEEKVHGDNPYALYEWWLRQIREGAAYTHRYFCVMCLAIYAAKCGVPYDRLYDDAHGLKQFLNDINPEHPFTDQDIESALECYDLRYVTFPLRDIETISAIPIRRNKRNGRSQAMHMKIMSSTRDVLYPDGSWRNRDGRPVGSGTKESVIKEYVENHPGATVTEIAKAVGASRTTVYKYNVPGKTTDSGHKWDDVWKSIYKGKREDGLDLDPNGYELMRTRRLRQYMEKLFEEEDT